MADCVKIGGIVAFPVREDEWNNLGYKEFAEQMEKDGIWSLTKRSEALNWINSETKLLYIYSLYKKN